MPQRVITVDHPRRLAADMRPAGNFGDDRVDTSDSGLAQNSGCHDRTDDGFVDQHLVQGQPPLGME